MVGMEIGNIAEWASIAWAVLSGIFMLISWYQSTGSKKARAEADDAVARAETQAKAAHAEAYEARRQTEAMQKLVESLQAQVHAAEASAAEAQRLADSAEKQVAQIEKIAESMRGPDFEVVPAGKNQFALTYRGDTPVDVSVSNIEQFVELYELEQPVHLEPGQTVQFFVYETYEFPIPHELVLDVEGYAQPVRVPLIKSR